MPNSYKNIKTIQCLKNISFYLILLMKFTESTTRGFLLFFDIFKLFSFGTTFGRDVIDFTGE